MKILLLGDYSNCHATLAEGLRFFGHDITVASNGSRWMNTPRTIDLQRKDGKLGGAIHYLRLKYFLHNRLKGYDIVAVNDPHFVSLKPVRLKKLFDRLKRENGKVFYTAMSDDIYYLTMLADPCSPLRYNEWFIDGKPSEWHLANTTLWNEWSNRHLVDYQKYFFDNIDGAVAVLYEYYKGLEYGLPKEKIGYGGIPVNCDRIPFVEPAVSKPVNLLLCRDMNREKSKGSHILLGAARELERAHLGDVKLSIAEKLPFEAFVKVLSQSHIVLDQVYSYTPATTALMAMAMGKTIVSGGEKDFFDFIGEKENFPIINARLSVHDAANDIEPYIEQPDLIRENAPKAREFVMKHNDYRVVAMRFLDFWTR